MLRTIQTALVSWDRSTFLAMNHGMKSRPLDYVVPLFTDLGLGHVQAIIVLCIAIALGARRGEIHPRRFARTVWGAIYSRRVWVGPLLVAFLVSGLVADTIKLLPRDRPWFFYGNEHLAGRLLRDVVYTVKGVYPLKVRGFPSGHSATSSAMATVVTILWHRRRRAAPWIAAAWVFAILIGLSRIYLASHWPLDVLGGFIVGIASGILTMWICRGWARRGSAAEKAGQSSTS